MPLFSVCGPLSNPDSRPMSGQYLCPLNRTLAAFFACIEQQRHMLSLERLCQLI